MLGVTREGRVLGFGISPHLAPQEFLDQLTNIVDVGLSYIDAAALTARGAVIDFGESPLPTEVSQLDNVIVLDVTGQFGDDDVDYKLAVTSDSRVLYWGRYLDLKSLRIPGVIAAAGGWTHIVALKSDGTVVQWEIHDDQLPAVVEGLSNVVAVAAGGEHSVALKADGTVEAWGENFRGQLDVPPDLADVVAISASEHHTLALKRDGSLAAWGENFNGDGVTAPADLRNVIAIATSGTTNLALVSFPLSAPSLTVEAFDSDLARLTLSLSGEPNQVYEIQSTSAFQIWEFLRYVTNDTATTSFNLEVIDPDKQFYRAR
jgi:hypothetical protein